MNDSVTELQKSINEFEPTFNNLLKQRDDLALALENLVVELEAHNIHAPVRIGFAKKLLEQIEISKAVVREIK